MDVGKDYTYRIVRRRDSDEEEEFEEFEDIKSNQPKPKRRYRKKKDLENQRHAFPGQGLEHRAVYQQQHDHSNASMEPTTVVRLTRRSAGELHSVDRTAQLVQTSQGLQLGAEGGEQTQVSQDNATSVAVPESMYVHAQKEQINGMQVITFVPQTDGRTDDEEDEEVQTRRTRKRDIEVGPIEIRPSGENANKKFTPPIEDDSSNSVYAVNHQGVHFQVVNVPDGAS